VPLQTRQAGLEGTGEIRLRDLVKESLRMRPSRLIVGEVRAEECLDLLLALNSGLPGMCTLHANSAREALVKMCTLPLLAGENIGARFVVPTVASSVDLVVHLGLDPHGVRRVSEIVAVPGRVENDVIETETVFERPTAHRGELRPTGGMPPHIERYEQVGIDVHGILAGADQARHSSGEV
jgi:pilus assembly protein CpaF